jgi:hypothetical protein
MRARLERGELWLDLMTRSEPFGEQRVAVTVPAS